MNQLFMSVIATSTMTLFSYTYSAWRNKPFKEPKLLNALMLRANIARVDINHPLGWIVHYLVGFLFISAYGIIWSSTILKPGACFFLIAAILSGALGVFVWRTVFKLHRFPPRINYREYYVHLIIAHLFFGAGAYGAFLLLIK